MGRWQPDARGRLERAALELFGEVGFNQATAAGIAARAGLTERTFFRHFADKREVLFGGAGELQELLAREVRDAPRSQAAPLDAIAAALEAAGPVFERRRAFVRQRQGVIADNVELQERELIKLARLSSALAGALRDHGVPDWPATLAAETGVALFKTAFQRWIDDPDAREFAPLVRRSLAELKAVTADSL